MAYAKTFAFLPKPVRKQDPNVYNVLPEGGFRVDNMMPGLKVSTVYDQRSVSGRTHPAIHQTQGFRLGGAQVEDSWEDNENANIDDDEVDDDCESDDIDDVDGDDDISDSSVSSADVYTVRQNAKEKVQVPSKPCKPVITLVVSGLPRRATYRDLDHDLSDKFRDYNGRIKEIDMANGQAYVTFLSPRLAQNAKKDLSQRCVLGSRISIQELRTAQVLANSGRFPASLDKQFQETAVIRPVGHHVLRSKIIGVKNSLLDQLKTDLIQRTRSVIDISVSPREGKITIDVSKMYKDFVIAEIRRKLREGQMEIQSELWEYFFCEDSRISIVWALGGAVQQLLMPKEFVSVFFFLNNDAEVKEVLAFCNKYGKVVSSNYHQLKKSRSKLCKVKLQVMFSSPVEARKVLSVSKKRKNKVIAKPRIGKMKIAHHVGTLRSSIELSGDARAVMTSDEKKQFEVDIRKKIDDDLEQFHVDFRFSSNGKWQASIIGSDDASRRKLLLQLPSRLSTVKGLKISEQHLRKVLCSAKLFNICKMVLIPRLERITSCVSIKYDKDGETFVIQLQSARLPELLVFNKLLAQLMKPDIFPIDAATFPDDTGSQCFHHLQTYGNVYVKFKKRNSCVAFLGGGAAKKELRTFLTDERERMVGLQPYSITCSVRGSVRALVEEYGPTLSSLQSATGVDKLMLNVEKRQLKVTGQANAIAKLKSMVVNICHKCSRRNIVNDTDTCPVCDDDVHNCKEHYRLEYCGHAYCMPCMEALLVNQTPPICCLYQDCSGMLACKDISYFNTNSPKLLCLLGEHALQAYLKDNPDNFVICPFPDCEGIVRKTKDCQVCPSCFNAVCAVCQTLYHYEESCYSFKQKTMQ